MHANYADFVERLISKYEGGYGWDKRDPGGPTKYGITCYDLATYRKQAMTSMAAWAPLVKDMTKSEAESIFWLHYGVPIRFNDLPPGIDCAMMDYAVLSGVARAQLVAKRLLSLDPSVPYSSVISVLRTYSSTKSVDFINRLCDERIAFMKAIKGGSIWVTFGKGWSARVSDNRSYATSLATGKIPPQANAPSGASPKAVNKDLHNVTKSGGVVAAGTGTVIAAGAAGLPWWVIVTAVVVTLLGAFVYSSYLTAKDLLANETVHLSQG